VADGTFFENEKFLDAVEYLKKNKSSLHIMGLTSSGGVHSHINHLFSLLEFAKKNRLKKVFVHCFMDGRDVPSDSGIDFIRELQKKLKKLRIGKIASMSGRFFAMDRDENWDRVEKAYKVMALGEGNSTEDPVKAIQNSYQNKVYDDQFEPVYIGKKGKPIALIGNKDVCINFDYRSDRARQISMVFADKNFDDFDLKKNFQDLKYITLTDYGLGDRVEIAFPVQKIINSLGEVISKNNLTQLRIAETEKYAHVTMFFNGGIIDPFPGEYRQLIPSPAVESYDLKPEMSAYEVTDRLLSQIEKYDFVLLNFANPDMLGHTGNILATTKGLSSMDECLGKIVKKVLAMEGQLIITADHGNADVMLNLQTEEIVKDHTVNPVPIILVSEALRSKNNTQTKSMDELSLMTPAGVLADVTTTALHMMGINKPAEMTGISLADVI
jgi:2,3-bisphosphoglycerate-independent phosphoglycerate mutase